MPQNPIPIIKASIVSLVWAISAWISGLWRCRKRFGAWGKTSGTMHDRASFPKP